jgi:hypothetical protein
MKYDDIEIREVETRPQLSAFIKLPWKLYKQDPNWVPPLISSQKQLLNRKKNPFFRYAKVRFFLAYHNRDTVGRIAIVNNHNHNTFHAENVGFFGYFESVDDYNVARKLLKVAMIHLKSDGLDAMRGPVNLSTNYEVGALVDGFDRPPVVNMTYNPRYYPEFYEKFGLTKTKDLLAYYISKDNPPPERVRRIAERTRQKEGVVVRSVNLKRFNEEVRLINRIYNSAWSQNWGFVPAPDDEFTFIAKDMKDIVDPDLVLIIEINGKPVGFSLALPNVYQVLPYANGRLLPFGLLKLLWHTKVRNKIDSARIITMGIEHEYQKRGLDNIFYVETFDRGRAKGYEWGEMSWVLEDNVLMNRVAKLLGTDVYKTYRIYEISLNSS